ncbi:MULTISPECIES: nitrate reductase cytochrome c-type subunit [Caballeronia]|jgi:nitrate reductase (cytochrome), electron transfer subunit|uniref:Periplasmic nitrate reductase, electron transfer subunit n=1 Tax=Caballeronia zhejiangensis TaxID=871203 RepID=A0A656QEZ2_9BURK|nr:MULTISPECIES: nitrate reductase cytochrome c-type subunit [Caballeronia]EKS70464.1 nitrate reductase cytochrome c-type subunit [Burkholderia sp. SJ98]KDR29002.1 nitrate reductase [Caballeronia zhejiangensis]MDR5767910.1 nitrate reductase cytochrome c-type subunit [Caballeronia sp. LZ028]MDR5790982.1 nitrate reductase cytochrome c-type subunit [Caballeronia sp. LP003]MDR5796508.1 nitrate reductase cytochrome c-type subunit [Caballeronia sp. LZ008]
MRTLTAIVIASLLALAVLAIAQPTVPSLPFHDSLRGTAPLDEEPKAPLIAPTENKDVIRGLNYAQQPPTIPHKIDNYQLDKNANRCLGCHARSRAEESGAVPVAVSHYMDREGGVSGHLSPRRYFCTQCHVPQADTKPLVGNTFVAVEDVRQQPDKTKKR